MDGRSSRVAAGEVDGLFGAFRNGSEVCAVIRYEVTGFAVTVV